MATYLSQPWQGSQFVSGVPIDMIVQVGQMKQAKFDRVQQEIQQGLDEIGNYDILKDSEKEYVNQKLKNATDTLNSFGGKDLSDRMVENSLKSTMSDLLRDKRISDAVQDTRMIRNNMQILNEIKEKHPDQYAAQNEKVFMNSINSYLNSKPGSRYDGQGYIPYYNYDEDWRDVAEQVAKNPDIQREIQYYTDPTSGQLMQRSEKEIKQVTRDKIAQGIMSSINGRAARQLQIDYQDNLSNKTVESAVSDLRNLKSLQLAKLKQLKDQRNAGITDANYLKATNDAISFLEGDGKDIMGAIPQTDQQIADIMSTGDVSSYYTMDKYMKDHVSGIADSYAYRQEGKQDYDALFLKQIDFQNDLLLEQVKAQNKLNAQNAKAAAAALGHVDNPFKQSLAELIAGGTGESNMDGAAMSSLFDSKLDDEGNFSISAASDPVYLSLGKSLQAMGVQEENFNKLKGIEEFNREYGKWSSTKEGSTPYTGPIYGATFGTNEPLPKPIEEFLKTKKGSEVAARIKTATGLDVANTQDLQNIKALASSPDAQAMQDIGNKISEGKFGTIKVRAMDGQNLIRGNDGKMYARMYAELTERQIAGSLGKGSLSTLLDKNLIQKSSNFVKEGKEEKQTYIVPIIKEVKGQISSKYINYLTGINKGDNFYTKNLPAYAEEFSQWWNGATLTQGMSKEQLTNDVKNTLDQMIRNTTQGDTNATLRQEAYRNKMNEFIAELNSPVLDPTTKISALNGLRELYQIGQTSLTPATPSKATINMQPGVTPRAGSAAFDTNNPGNVMYNPNDSSQKALGAVDSGIPIKNADGTNSKFTFAKFPTIEAGNNYRKNLIFGTTDGTFKSQYYKPDTTVDQAMRKYSNYDASGKVGLKGYTGDIYPEVKNKTLKELTPEERNELIKRMTKIEDASVYHKLYSQQNQS